MTDPVDQAKAWILDNDGDTTDDHGEIETMLRALVAEVERLRPYYTLVHDSWDETCDDGCDSWGHTVTCKCTNLTQAFIAAKADLATERALVRDIMAERDAARAEVERLDKYACDLSDNWTEAEADLAALRQRHAEAVGAWDDVKTEYANGHGLYGLAAPRLDAALASEAKARLT